MSDDSAPTVTGNADRMTAAGRDPSIRSRLARVCGHRRGRTRVGVVGLLALVAVVLLSVWLPRATGGGERPSISPGTVESVVSVGILAVVASVGLAFCYAAWNGGPLLSYGVAVVPELVGTVAAGGRSLDHDVAIVLAAGAAAAATALYSSERRRTGAWRPSPSRHLVDGLTLVTTLVIVALGALLELRAAAGPHVARLLLAAWLLWFLGATVVIVEWVVCLRAEASTESARRYPPRER